MAGEWTVRPIDECMAAVIDYRGKTPKKTSFGIPLITAKVVKGGRIEAPEEFIADADYDSWMRRGIPETGDIVITTEAPLGEVAQLGAERVALAQRLIALRGKPGLLDNGFLKFLLQSDDVQSQLRARASGTTVLGIKQSELRKVLLKLPSVEEQRDIAHILGTLDNKIELNRRMSETLEAMARALFKSWFVDFDPVRAKMDGRDSGLPKHIADLFPDRLVDSELGEIPEGWGTKPIGDVVKVVGGSTPSTKVPAYWDGEYCWTTPKDLSGLAGPVLLDTQRRITEKGLKKISSGLLPINTLLLSSRAPVGYLAIAKVPVAINQGYIAIPPENPLGNLFLLYWCEVNMGRIKERAGGTTFQEISKTNFRPILLVVPPSNLIDQFENFVRPIFERIVRNEQESRTLTSLRDTMLPKLVSGEIRAPASAKITARAVS